MHSKFSNAVIIYVRDSKFRVLWVSVFILKIGNFKSSELSFK